MKRLKLGLFNVGASVCVLQQVALKDNLSMTICILNVVILKANTLTSWFFLDFTSAF